MGVCRWAFNIIKIIKVKFPSTVIIYINRNSKKRGIWSLGSSVNPKRMNSVTIEPFARTILLQDNLWTKNNIEKLEDSIDLPTVACPKNIRYNLTISENAQHEIKEFLAKYSSTCPLLQYLRGRYRKLRPSKLSLDI